MRSADLGCRKAGANGYGPIAIHAGSGRRLSAGHCANIVMVVVVLWSLLLLLRLRLMLELRLLVLVLRYLNLVGRDLCDSRYGYGCG